MQIETISKIQSAKKLDIAKSRFRDTLGLQASQGKHTVCWLINVDQFAAV